MRIVQGMGGDGNQLAQRARGQAGIAVQSQDIADAFGHPLAGRERHEAIPVPRGKRPHQHFEFAALALPPQPALLRFTPAARPVDQQEARRRSLVRGQAGIQLADLDQCVSEQRRVGVQSRGIGVRPVGQQRELRVPLPVRQPVPLELFEQQAGRPFRIQHRGNHDQHGMVRRDPCGKFQAWQELNLQRLRKQPMDQRGCRLRGRPGQQKQDQGCGPIRQVDTVRSQPQQHCRPQSNGGHVERQARTAAGCYGAWQVQGGGQRSPAVPEQVVAGGAFDGRTAGVPRDRQNRLCDLEFTAPGVARELFHGACDLLARQLAFAGKAGELAQHAQRPADRLDQFYPVDLADQPQRRDDVADGQIRSHLGRLAFHHQRRAVGAVPFHPLHQRRRAVQVIGRCALPQLREPGAAQPATGHLGVEDIELCFADAIGGIAHRMRQFPRHLARCDFVGHAAEVFEQHNPQGGGQGPQLGQAQLAHFLVSVQERAEDFRVQHAVRMGHVGPGDAIDARQARQGSRRQFRQLGVIAARHPFADLLQLRFDQVEVVQQPLGRRCHVMAAAGRQCDLVISLAQRLQVGFDPREKRTAFADCPVLDHLRQCEAAAVFLETVNAKQFRADRRLGFACRLQDLSCVGSKGLEPVDGRSIGRFQASASNRHSPAATNTAPVVTMRAEASARTLSTAQRR